MIAICGRKGAVKLKHIRLGLLWVQEHINKGELKIQKVPGEDNPADLMTKHISEAKMLKHCAVMNIYS